jgi:hypothetical protein
MITFSENHQSALISFEEGQALASVNDPHAEGLRWAYGLGALPSKHVVIVGLGSGFHVAALAEIDPQLKIYVIDSRETLVPIFRSQFADIADRVEVIIASSEKDLRNSDAFEEIVHNRAYVLSFQECWGERKENFSTLFAHLTGRSVESLRFHFEELGMNVKALHFDHNRLLSIKDISGFVESSNLNDSKKQIFRTLNELVKS